jgi:hypothetical protein
MYDHAGDAYYRLGYVEKAAAMWKKAVEVGKEEKDPSREDRELLKRTPEKLKAVEDGREAQVAPLGKGVSPGGR